MWIVGSIKTGQSTILRIVKPAPQRRLTPIGDNPTRNLITIAARLQQNAPRRIAEQRTSPHHCGRQCVVYVPGGAELYARRAITHCLPGRADDRRREPDPIKIRDGDVGSRISGGLCRAILSGHRLLANHRGVQFQRIRLLFRSGVLNDHYGGWGAWFPGKQRFNR